jgi:hypothetical protein
MPRVIRLVPRIDRKQMVDNCVVYALSQWLNGTIWPAPRIVSAIRGLQTRASFCATTCTGSGECSPRISSIGTRKRRYPSSGIRSSMRARNSSAALGIQYARSAWFKANCYAAAFSEEAHLAAFPPFMPSVWGAHSERQIRPLESSDFDRLKNKIRLRRRGAMLRTIRPLLPSALV